MEDTIEAVQRLGIFTYTELKRYISPRIEYTLLLVDDSKP